MGKARDHCGALIPGLNPNHSPKQCSPFPNAPESQMFIGGLKGGDIEATTVINHGDLNGIGQALQSDVYGFRASMPCDIGQSFLSNSIQRDLEGIRKAFRMESICDQFHLNTVPFRVLLQ